MIGFTVPVMIRVIADNQMNTRINREFYSDQAVSFFATGADRNDMEYIMENMKEGDILYGEIDRYCRGVYVKDHKNALPVIEGRSFQSTDFFAGRKLALIGRNLRNDCKMINGRYYYMLQKEPYEVIGTLGIQSPSLLDNYLWINLDAMLDTFSPDGFYVLDGGRNCGRILHDVRLTDIVSEVRPEEVGIKAMYKERSTGLVIFSLLLACFLICASVCISFWLEGQKYVMTVKRLCGIPNFYVRLELWMDLIITCGLSFCCGSLIAVLLWKNGLPG